MRGSGPSLAGFVLWLPRQKAPWFVLGSHRRWFSENSQSAQPVFSQRPFSPQSGLSLPQGVAASKWWTVFPFSPGYILESPGPGMGGSSLLGVWWLRPWLGEELYGTRMVPEEVASKTKLLASGTFWKLPGRPCPTMLGPRARNGPQPLQALGIYFEFFVWLPQPHELWGPLKCQTIS